MHWIPIAAWIAAALVAVVVLGFCAYELSWKVKRLRTDLGELLALNEELAVLQGGLTSAQRRIAVAAAELR